MRATREFRSTHRYGSFGWDSLSCGAGMYFTWLGVDRYRSGVTLTLSRRAAG